MTNHNIHMALQVVPLDRESDVYKKIDAAIEVIQQSGVKHLITPMETVMEGPYEQLKKIVEEAQQALVEEGCSEFLVNIKMHVRTDADVTFEEKRLER